MEKKLDCMGMACPLPVINAKKAMEAFTEDGTLYVKVDNEIAVQNLSRLGSSRGFEVSSGQNGEKEYTVAIQVKAADAGTGSDSPQTGSDSPQTGSCRLPMQGGKVVVLSSDTMGNGDEKLGKKLMKAFVFALTSQDEAPEKVICYNTGAFLTTEDPDTVRDLKSLEEAGTTVMTCGTCLDFYGLKEKLQVGIISNMYDIVEAQMSAALLIRP